MMEKTPTLREDPSSQLDLEANVDTTNAHLSNTTIHSLAWRSVTVTVKHRQLKQPLDILSESQGCVRAGWSPQMPTSSRSPSEQADMFDPGEMLAIMGPSGSGKTTLLNVLAQRTGGAQTTQGEVLVNGHNLPWSTFRRISSYVEQEDALIGSLTVRETLDFSARLSLPSSVKASERMARIDELLTSMGLSRQASTLVGTPIRKGISGGQKRRVSVASQLIAGPKILFLDEPTSGLDSAASHEVMSFVRGVAKKHNLIIIASVHQPSTSTFLLFDRLLLLSGSKTCYYGPTASAKAHFDSISHPMPPQINPAEFLIDLVNVDFSTNRDEAERRLETIQDAWANSDAAVSLASEIEVSVRAHDGKEMLSPGEMTANSKMLIPVTLLHRSLIKSYRDVVAYGIRIAMYTGLAIMMGTVWLRLDTTQESIQPFINAIFFGSAFMSFMAVAYVPAFLEDRAMYVKERANGLYGATAFTVANFLIGLPYLFFIALLFSTLAYFLSNFAPGATAFFTWVMWLFLDLVAAESLVVLISSLFPNFVLALAITAFANGLWMCVGGFLVEPGLLNVFWRYVFHYIDYQTYVFQGMMVNEFSRRTYTCAADCRCMYSSALEGACRIDGKAVLEVYGYGTGRTGRWVGILLGIVVGYRLLGWAVLWVRRT